jgi:hypothetical protein
MYDQMYDTKEYSEGYFRRLEDGTIERNNCERTCDTFLASVTSVISIPLSTPDGYKVVAEMHYILRPGEKSRSLLDELKQLQEHPSDWEELGPEELGSLSAYDGTIEATVRHTATQFQNYAQEDVETDAGDDTQLAYTIIHTLARPNIQDIKRSELTGKLLHMMTGEKAHSDPKYAYSGRSE